MKTIVVVKKITLYTAIIFLVLLTASYINHNFFYKHFTSAFNATDLNAEEIDCLNDYFLLEQHLLGQWNINDFKDIPLIIYNEQFEFFIHKFEPKPGWQLINSSSQGELKIYRRPRRNPSSFAIEIDNKWAGIILSRDLMNKQVVKGLEQESPGLLYHFVPLNLFEIEQDFYVSLMFHETFHAVQARQSEAKFLKSTAVYKKVENYPLQSEEQIELWNLEGTTLLKTLNAGNKTKTLQYLEEWLSLRQERRNKYGNNLDFIQFEKRLEWLEGLARYAEMEAYVFLSEQKGTKLRYHTNARHWADGWAKIENGLGRLEGDRRFYLSGMVQAKILDKLSPAWKETVFRDSIFLEDMLKSLAHYKPTKE